MKNKTEDLRNHLLTTIEGLLDEDKSLDVEHVKTVAHVDSVIVEPAKMEVKALEIIGSPDGSGSTFLQISRGDSKWVFWNLRHRTLSGQSRGYSVA